ncbi:MAG: GNAT family N-acetyltransferase [Planctomycetes bacterium]|nr:GNAT family N-acetyltransferase [Planctomycetota bacterium]
MPDASSWVIEKLHKRHDRAAFSCGVVELDDYLHRFAGQNEKTGISQHFVAVATAGDSRILGYYALSAGSVAFDLVPDELRKRLPRYPIPVAHIGRLAVDQSMQGQGLGEDLLIDALVRIVRIADELGIHAVEVVAINDSAQRFYLKYGFTPLADDERHLYLPLSAARKLDFG